MRCWQGVGSWLAGFFAPTATAHVVVVAIITAGVLSQLFSIVVALIILHSAF
jgi:hypothetical protein